jgi:2'-5' RNA ligase
MRLFIAVLLDDPVRSALRSVQDSLRARSVKGRFSSPENLHLTLAFLGELPGTALDLVKSCMDKAVSGFAAPLTLACSHLDRFSRREGDLYYAALFPLPALLQLHAQLIEALSGANLPYDPKPFRPHLTLGRNVVLQPGASMESIPFAVPDLSVSSIDLMESKRVQGTLVYTPHYRAYLV